MKCKTNDLLHVADDPTVANPAKNAFNICENQVNIFFALQAQDRTSSMAPQYSPPPIHLSKQAASCCAHL
jgi:hypothetical protein